MKIVSYLFFALIMACSQGDSTKSYESEDDVITHKLLPTAAAEVNNVESSATSEDQKIIKTARLVFETKDVETTHQKIIQLAAQYKAMVQSDNSGKDYNRIYKDLTIRVPTEKFQEFINAISKGVEYFEQRTITLQDVSEEFVDLEARLKAKRTLENRYLELLKKANNVKEMLEIERELSNIREEIEAKQGRLQYLQNQVSMSTVNIEFYKTTAEKGITQSYGQKMKNALQGGWNGISVFFLGILYLWPLFLIAIIVIVVVRILLKKRRIRNSKK